MVYDEIKRDCEELGMSVSELCRRAGVTRPTLENWKAKNPKSIENYLKIQEIIKQEKECRKQLLSETSDKMPN
jgi:transcriptional regulator with XRE-family HTH domain